MGASKNEDIQTLQNRVLVLERDVRRKHREMEAHKADLNTSRQEIRQKEGVHVESITAWQNECSKLQDRVTELEEENAKNKGKRRRLETSQTTETTEEIIPDSGSASNSGTEEPRLRLKNPKKRFMDMTQEEAQRARENFKVPVALRAAEGTQSEQSPSITSSRTETNEISRTQPQASRASISNTNVNQKQMSTKTKCQLKNKCQPKTNVKH